MLARHTQEFAGIFDFYLGAEHELAQPFQGRQNQLARQDRNDPAGMGQ